MNNDINRKQGMALARSIHKRFGKDKITPMTAAFAILMLQSDLCQDLAKQAGSAQAVWFFDFMLKNMQDARQGLLDDLGVMEWGSGDMQDLDIAEVIKGLQTNLD